MNSGEDERLRGDGDDAITLGVRMSVPCDCHVPTYPDGKSSGPRALELLPSGLGLVRSLLHIRTGCIACTAHAQAYGLPLPLPLLLLLLLKQ
jgi:hypothetical protein